MKPHRSAPPATDVGDPERSGGRLPRRDFGIVGSGSPGLVASPPASCCRSSTGGLHRGDRLVKPGGVSHWPGGSEPDRSDVSSSEENPAASTTCPRKGEGEDSFPTRARATTGGKEEPGRMVVKPSSQRWTRSLPGGAILKFGGGSDRLRGEIQDPACHRFISHRCLEPCSQLLP